MNKENQNRYKQICYAVGPVPILRISFGNADKLLAEKLSMVDVAIDCRKRWLVVLL